MWKGGSEVPMVWFMMAPNVVVEAGQQHVVRNVRSQSGRREGKLNVYLQHLPKYTDQNQSSRSKFRPCMFDLPAFVIHQTLPLKSVYEPAPLA